MLVLLLLVVVEARERGERAFDRTLAVERVRAGGSGCKLHPDTSFQLFREPRSAVLLRPQDRAGARPRRAARGACVEGRDAGLDDAVFAVEALAEGLAGVGRGVGRRILAHAVIEERVRTRVDEPRIDVAVGEPDRLRVLGHLDLAFLAHRDDAVAAEHDDAVLDRRRRHRVHVAREHGDRALARTALAAGSGAARGFLLRRSLGRGLVLRRRRLDGILGQQFASEQRQRAGERDEEVWVLPHGGGRRRGRAFRGGAVLRTTAAPLRGDFHAVFALPIRGAVAGLCRQVGLGELPCQHLRRVADGAAPPHVLIWRG